MKTLITILVVGRLPEYRENMRKLLAFEPDFKQVGSAATGQEGIDLAKQHRPDVVLVDALLDDMPGFDAAKQISQAVPFTRIIMTALTEDLEIQRFAGAVYWMLDKPIDMERLYHTIYSAAGRHPPKPVPPPAPPPKPERDGQVIAFHSATGGTGCTTVAINLAYACHQVNMKTLLIDACLPAGSLATILAINGKTNLLTALEAASPEEFEAQVMTHSTGLKVLPGLFGKATLTGGLALRDRPPEALTRLIAHARQQYDMVLLDLGTSSGMAPAVLLDLADVTVLVLNPTLISIAATSNLIEWLQSLNFPVERVCPVLNKMRQGKHIPAREKIQHYLKQPVVEAISQIDEDMLLSAVNRGMPVLATGPDLKLNPFTAQIVTLRDLLLDRLLNEEP